jgi:uridine phosphorylase
MFMREEDYTSRELFTPEDLLRHYAESKGCSLYELSLHEVVIGSFSSVAAEELRRLCGVRPTPRPRVHEGSYRGRAVSLIEFPVGAPIAAATLEEAIACGGRRFLVVGMAGTLGDLPIGSFMIPTDAVREEGTSYHYLPPGAPVRPSGRLARVLEEACLAQGIEPIKGTNWTTDAPYRELVSKVERHRRAGVLTVEMEAAALFAVAEVRRVEVAVLLVISDRLGKRWEPALFSEEVKRSLRKAARVVLEAAHEL